MLGKKSILVLCLVVLALVMANCTRRSASHRTRSQRATQGYVERSNRTHNRGGKTTIKMRHDNGVYHVPCKINGVEMELIFDTGASDVTISLTEAMFLIKQNKLTDDDVVGAAYYQIADGSVAEGTVVNLKSVTIGDRTIHNVKASIVHNMEAPLLLGQSALSAFGRISIDYNRNEIIFE